MRRIITVLAIMALSACGTGTATPGAADQSTTLPETSSTATQPATTTSVSAEPGTTQQAASTATSAPATTTTHASPATTAAQPTGKMVVAPYFFVDEEGHPNRTGPFLLPVGREVERTIAVARAAMEQLLAGPDSGETQGIPGISTMIPAGVRLLGLTIDAGVATVDLSKEFEATDDAASVAQRASQVVFTLTRFSTVDAVLLRQEGKPVSIQTGDGQLVDRPVTRDDYLEFAAALSIESPVYGEPAASPLRVTGFGAAFEATFRYALTDGDGVIIEEAMAMTDNGTGWGDFDFTIHYDVDHEQRGALIVWINSAKDGSRIDIREYPVVLTP